MKRKIPKHTYLDVTVKAGQVVKALRLHQNISTYTLGRRAAMSHSQVQVIESGESNAPLGTYARLARALDCELFELLQPRPWEHLDKHGIPRMSREEWLRLYTNRPGVGQPTRAEHVDAVQTLSQDIDGMSADEAKEKLCEALLALMQTQGRPYYVRKDKRVPANHNGVAD